MKSIRSSLGLALAIAAGSFAGPAAAQQQAGRAEAAAPAITPSKPAFKAILELQEAVEADDRANIPARVAAAEAVATTAEDRYLIAMLRLKAAVAAEDAAAKSSALETLIASGKLTPAQLASAQLDLAAEAYNSKQFDRAAASFERVLAADPNNDEALKMLAETRHSQGRTKEAVDLLERAIAQAKAAGGMPQENLYKRAVALAYTAKLPDAVELSRGWVADYPTEESWRDALRIYRNLQKPPEPVLIDVLRLGRAVGALQGEADYYPYAYAAIEELVPGEVEAVIGEGVAGGSLKADDQHVREILADARSKSAGQKERLPALSSDALGASGAKMAVNAANIHYSYGNFAEAAKLYRAALDKTGADKDLVNLRLGMALARAGDRAGATAALNAVTGQRAEIARYWLTYLQTRA